jgi:hypothetical protein
LRTDRTKHGCARVRLLVDADAAAVGAAHRRIAVVRRIVDARLTFGTGEPGDAAAERAFRRALAAALDGDTGSGSVASVGVGDSVATAHRIEFFRAELGLRATHAGLPRVRTAPPTECITELTFAALAIEAASARSL